MRDQLEYIVTERTENHARIVLAPREGSSISHIAGVVRGPFSDFSKTLTSDSPIKPGTVEGTFEALVVEPCYWTPRLPFWYDLRLKLGFEDGQSREEVIPVGFKRFYCDRRNFLLEGKRVVLRGMGIDTPTSGDLQSARKYETALIVQQPSPESCQRASRFGVPLLADLRGRELSRGSLLDWYPAVVSALVTADQAGSLSLRNTGRMVLVDARGGEPSVQCDGCAIELQPGERPPQWAAHCNKPVIVIRKDPEAEIITARADCDRLQADLAPEFDLAGYFV